MSVCPSILAAAGRTTGPILIRETPFDASERRKDDGANRGPISTTQGVPRAAARNLAKSQSEEAEC